MTARITSPQQKQMNRLVEEVVAALGLSKDAAQRVLAQGGIFKEKLTPILRELAAEKFASQIHAPELIPDWGTIVEDVEPKRGLDMKKLEYIGFLEGKEEYVGGEEMRKRSVKLKGNLGLSDAKYLLAHQDEIPTELRGKYIVLPGTVLRRAGGSRRVPYLGWGGDRWILCFYWLSGNFFGGGRLVRSK